MTQPCDTLVFHEDSPATIVFRNSPGVEVTVERGGTDPVSGDARPERWVRLSWPRPQSGEGDEGETAGVEVWDFLGPPSGVEVTVERGGTDAVTGDPRPEQWVRLSWTDPETSQTEVRESLGP